MFSLACFLLPGILALGPHVVLGSFEIQLPPVTECQPVQITFSGQGANNHSVPTTFTVLPLVDDAVPIRIPIPNGATNSTGVAFSFIPLPAGTDFIASLDDVEGISAQISDITRVAPPDGTGDPTCLASVHVPTASFYAFNHTIVQCEVFSITYNTTAPPNITAFQPRGGSWSLPLLANADNRGGIASYTMIAMRQSEWPSCSMTETDICRPRISSTVILNPPVSTLLLKEPTVVGDSSSSTACFPPSLDANAGEYYPTPAGMPKPPPKGLSAGAVIGITTGASAFALALIFMLWFYLRRRRQNRRTSNVQFNRGLLDTQRWPEEEKQIDFSSPTLPPASLSATGFVRDPIYTNEKYAASLMADNRSDASSWRQYTPESPGGAGDTPNRRTSTTSSRLSMATVDVHNILSMATVHGDRSSSVVPAEVTVSPEPGLAKPALARLVTNRRERKSVRSDMPIPALSPRRDSTDAALAGLPAAYTQQPSFASWDGNEGPEEDIGNYPMAPFQQPAGRDSLESWGNARVR
ncbi:unnamed protein product [Mycena citricolor]|uniref:Uncharacterized protein n=1 Tax=Mycena citricolor TaxID=2018698 RepID=A0AAD2I0D4_9AGAR|nr:unnamed protein product [Mycena citricolor]